MTVTHKNFLKTTISAVASSGLGALTISTASSGYRTFGAGDDGLTFDGITITEGTAWEVRDGCVYTHSGTSLARGTLQDSSTGSAIAFTAAAVVDQNPSAGLAGRIEQVALVRATGGDSSITLAPNTHYTWDLSTLTADRTGTLPTTAAVGDAIEISAITGNASYELLLSTGSGQTCALGATVVAASTEITRLLMAGESMRFVYEATNKWTVQQDGRIPIQARSTAAGSGSTTQSISAATYTLVNANLMTEEVDNSSSMGSDGGSKMRFTARRAGQFSISGGGYLNIAEDQKTYIGAIALNGESVPNTKLWRVWSSGTGGAMANTGVNGKALAVGDYINLAVYQGGTGAFNLQDNAGFTYLSVTEVL